MHFVHHRKGGFTLVEVLVAVSIVALLSMIAYSGFTAIRKKARDQERRAELGQLALALRQYKDSYGRYPAAGCSSSNWTSPGPGVATWYTSCDIYITGLVPSIMAELPKDPDETKSDSGYMYFTDAAGADYKVIAHDTVESGVVNAGSDMARCPASCGQSYCSQNSYAVYSAGAACW